ncbi:MAG: GNAT family N-acetyltransferase [Candidatus Cybelea sp.]
MTIRSAREDDVESVTRLHFLVREVSMPYLPVLHTVEDALVFFATVFKSSYVLVAEYERAIIAYASFRADWLDHLYVHPGHQRRGIGSALLERAMRATGSLKLWVFQRNVGARKFYERHGFALVRVTDGSGNEEREPDVLYEWPSQRSASPGRQLAKASRV